MGRRHGGATQGTFQGTPPGSRHSSNYRRRKRPGAGRHGPGGRALGAGMGRRVAIAGQAVGFLWLLAPMGTRSSRMAVDSIPWPLELACAGWSMFRLIGAMAWGQGSVASLWGLMCMVGAGAGWLRSAEDGARCSEPEVQTRC